MRGLDAFHVGRVQEYEGSSTSRLWLALEQRAVVMMDGGIVVGLVFLFFLCVISGRHGCHGTGYDSGGLFLERERGLGRRGQPLV